MSTPSRRFDDGLLDAVRAALEPSQPRLGFPGMHLPGLLHTEEYICALFDHAHRRRSAGQEDNDVTVRRIRQQRLTSEADPLELVAVITLAGVGSSVGDGMAGRRIVVWSSRPLARVRASRGLPGGWL